MTRMLWHRMMLVVVALVAAGTAQLNAQARAVSFVRDDGRNPVRAADLHAQARVLLMNTARYREAGAMLRQAASLRAPGDDAAVGDLVLAGKVYAYANDLGPARKALVDGAALALRFGDVVTAANAYVDAAFVALQARDLESMRALTASAERLAGSRHITREQRMAIMMRINPARAYAAAR